MPSGCVKISSLSMVFFLKLRLRPNKNRLSRISGISAPREYSRVATSASFRRPPPAEFHVIVPWMTPGDLIRAHFALSRAFEWS